MPLDPVELSALPTQNTLADADLVTGLDASAATPATKNVNFALAKLAEFVLAKIATVSKAEAEAGAATTARWWTAERVKEAILALSPAGTKHQLAGTRAPLGTDDQTQGYSPGSLWMWVAEGRVWIARTTATNIAEWIELTSEGGGSGEGNPPAASPEEAAAGEAADLRSWSPALVKTAVEALAPSGGGEGEDNPPAASPEEAAAGAVADLRSWSPALVKIAVEALAPGGGGSSATAYERQAWGWDEELYNDASRHIFLAPVSGTITAVEVESRIYGGRGVPSFRVMVSGSPKAPTVTPNVGGPAFDGISDYDSISGRASVSIPVSSGQAVGIYVIESGQYMAMAALGLRVVVWFEADA